MLWAPLAEHTQLPNAMIIHVFFYQFHVRGLFGNLGQIVMCLNFPCDNQNNKIKNNRIIRRSSIFSERLTS